MAYEWKPRTAVFLKALFKPKTVYPFWLIYDAEHFWREDSGVDWCHAFCQRGYNCEQGQKIFVENTYTSNEFYYQFILRTDALRFFLSHQ